MSTRQTKLLSPSVRGVALHVYRDVLDGWLYVDVSRGYGFHFPFWPTRRELPLFASRLVRR